MCLASTCLCIFDLVLEICPQTEHCHSEFPISIIRELIWSWTAPEFIPIDVKPGTKTSWGSNRHIDLGAQYYRPKQVIRIYLLKWLSMISRFVNLQCILRWTEFFTNGAGVSASLYMISFNMFPKPCSNFCFPSACNALPTHGRFLHVCDNLIV